MSDSGVVVRFAPSPTGSLHIGGARTALYNWLYARHTGGKMLLRIEDTDIERSTPENVQIILDGLRWLGIDWDAPPVYQSQRVGHYRPLIQRLLDEGKAYRCVCTKEELDAKREAAIADKRKYLYDRTCRDRNLGPDCGPHTIRIKLPRDGEIAFRDVILGPISMQASEFDDWIIARSDLTPVYNFVVVADDHDMGITHVIRGNDHLNNTPKQLIVYEALGFTPPAFAHMPLTHGADGKKLSKRHGAAAVTDFAKLGYLPQAVRNYLVRLGWSHGDQELFTDEELIAFFDIHDCNASPGIMDLQKLEWINQQKMMSLPPSEVATEWLPYLRERGYEIAPGAWLDRLVEVCRERFKTLVEMADHVRYFFADPESYDDKAAKKWLAAANVELIELLATRIENIADFTESALEEMFGKICEERGVGLGQVAQPVRVALTGNTVSPPIFDTIVLLGRERTVARLRRAAVFASNSG